MSATPTKSVPVEAFVTDFHGEVTVKRGGNGLIEVHCIPIIRWDNGTMVRIKGETDTIIRETDDPNSLEMEVTG